MKMWIVVGLMLVGVNVFAGTTRGYLVENNRLEFYYGLGFGNDETQLALMWFNKAQIATMKKCMLKRNTHAIEVTSHETKIPGVPTGIPGRTTTAHGTSIDKISCVSAPGFINRWRSIVNAQQ